ncbi:MAG TPA: hypothetical protein PL045_02755 [Chitinophagaceae bacterium]|nr:hypothetical protein [Chitinophagaceae bacterium]
MGEQLCAVEKAMGLKKGEKIKKLTIIEVEQHSFEPLNTITQQEVINEGFPGMTPEEFIEMFCATHKNCKPHTTVTRIQFKYV